MTDKELPPYVNATGTLQKLFNKIKEAAIPPRITHDFLATKLGLGNSGSTKAMVPFLKKIGFIGTDGVPNETYRKFRNPDSSIAGAAIADAMRIGYQELYDRNEYFHTLSKEKMKSFLVEATGAEAKSTAITSLTNTIEVLKSLANFEAVSEDKKVREEYLDKSISTAHPISSPTKTANTETDFNISYTINLNLPETSDPAVFDAIFKSLKEHILKNEN